MIVRSAGGPRPPAMDNAGYHDRGIRGRVEPCGRRTPARTRSRTVTGMALPSTRLPDAWAAMARHRPASDVLLGALVGGLSLLAVVAGHRAIPGRSLTAADGLIAAAAALLTMLRRRWPVPVLGLATLAAAWGRAVSGERYELTAVTVICAYTVACRSPRTTAWVAGPAAALVVYGAAMVFQGQAWDSAEALEDLAWMGMALALGDAVRARRAYVAAIEERAVRAEQSRDEEARRRVAEERLRIARELHDVVAHHIALINVQVRGASLS